MTWPVEDAEKLKAMWAEGLEIGHIAKAINKSKNAAYHKVLRLKLSRRYNLKKSSCS